MEQHDHVDLPAKRLAFIRHYLVLITVGNLVWEFLQMPLYTVWRTGSAKEIVYSGIHCTIGDVLISVIALALACLIAGRSGWPDAHRLDVAIATIVIGLCYTTISEWFNVSIRKSWAYSELMPLLAGAIIGLAPLAQWIVLPTIAFFGAYRQIPPGTARISGP